MRMTTMKDHLQHGGEAGKRSDGGRVGEGWGKGKGEGVGHGRSQGFRCPTIRS